MNHSLQYTWLLALIATLCTATFTRPTFANDPPIVLDGATVFDGTGSVPIESAVIVIDDGKIVHITGENDAVVPKGAKQIDYRGKFIIPSLIAAHAHVGQVNGLENGSVNYNRDNILRQLRQYEAYGVTTVVSLGVNAPLFYKLREELHAGTVPGADLFGADRGLGVAGGAPPATALKVEPDQLDRPETPEQARAAVRAAKERGTDLIKLWLDDFAGSLPVKMKPEIYTAIIDEARRQNLRVAAHVFYLDDAKSLVKAGVDILAHGVRDQDVDDEFIQLMKDKSVWYIPTIGVDESNYIFAMRPGWVSEKFLANALQPAVREQFETPAWREKTLANPSLAKWQQNVKTNQANLKKLHDAGVKIGLGADSGANPVRIPGFAEHRELQLMVDAGLPPLDALKIATANSAELLGLEDRGQLAPGKLADLIVLEANPSENIAEAHRIHAVWHRGKQASGKIEDFKP